MEIFKRLYFNLRYIGRPPWDSGVSPPELISFLKNNPPSTALDMGCGTGTNVITLAKYDWQVTGVDFAPRAIRIAKRKTRKVRQPVRLMTDDVTVLTQLNERFDLILDIGCMHSIPVTLRNRYMGNVLRLLSLNGTYLLYAFTKESIEEPGPGVTNEELTSLTNELELINREDGTERGWKSSAWFTFKGFTEKSKTRE